MLDVEAEVCDKQVDNSTMIRARSRPFADLSEETMIVLRLFCFLHGNGLGRIGTVVLDTHSLRSLASRTDVC